MKTITYHGPFDAVEVPYIEDGQPRWFQAAPGVPAECPDELAARLLEQTDTWRESPAKARTKTEANN